MKKSWSIFEAEGEENNSTEFAKPKVFNFIGTRLDIFFRHPIELNFKLTAL